MTTHEVRRGRRVRLFVWVLGFHGMKGGGSLSILGLKLVRTKRRGKEITRT